MITDNNNNLVSIIHKDCPFSTARFAYPICDLHVSPTCRTFCPNKANSLVSSRQNDDFVIRAFDTKSAPPADADGTTHILQDGSKTHTTSHSSGHTPVLVCSPNTTRPAPVYSSKYDFHSVRLSYSTEMNLSS
jgi:hypothetical protein